MACCMQLDSTPDRCIWILDVLGRGVSVHENIRHGAFDRHPALGRAARAARTLTRYASARRKCWCCWSLGEATADPGAALNWPSRKRGRGVARRGGASAMPG